VSVTTAVASRGRQRTPMDGRSQVRHTAALVLCTAAWLRDEEAAGSNPATPDSGRCRSQVRPVIMPVAMIGQVSDFGSGLGADLARGEAENAPESLHRSTPCLPGARRWHSGIYLCP
jgi:hypothetical protein